MIARWCISIFIFIVTLFGVVSQQHINLPNQEIVLQFTNDSISLNEVKNTIEILKNQLQTHGVENIQVVELEEGNIKITYYSDADVASIKKILSEEKSLNFDYALNNQEGNESKIPSNHSNTYNLNVFEIHKQNTGADFGGKYALEQKSENNRFFIPNLYVSSNEIIFRNTDFVFKEVNKFRNITFVIDNTSYKIPDGRAGPMA